jgi:hypothetical protein
MSCLPTIIDSRGTAVLERIRVLEAEIKRDEDYLALGKRMMESGSRYDPDRESKLFQLYITHPGFLAFYGNDPYQLIDHMTRSATSMYGRLGRYGNSPEHDVYMYTEGQFQGYITGSGYLSRCISQKKEELASLQNKPS